MFARREVVTKTAGGWTQARYLRLQPAPPTAAGVRGLVFSVQSSALPPPELEARVDGFLGGFRATLAAMPEAELDTYREALAVQVSDVDKRLVQQAGHSKYE